MLLREEAAVREGSGGQHALAYRVSLLVLRDYMSSGYYPVVSGSRCLLAPILESSALTPAKRRIALQRMYRAARDRALLDRDQFGWMQRTAMALRANGYSADGLVLALAAAPPKVVVKQVTSSARIGDARGLWRAVRATWSMGPEMSAPGREVAIVVSDERFCGVPLGIAQFRNVVPEIQARDQWLGVSSGGDGSGGYLGLVDSEPREARHRLAQTRDELQKLLSHVNPDGLEGVDVADADLSRVAAIIQGSQARYRAERREGAPDAHRHLAYVKRAETVSELTRGIRALTAAIAVEEPTLWLRQNPRLRRDLDAGLKKLWHYHMGFVAIEMSICGAAPPFGPLRVGKLVAALAGSREVVEAWGTERPLGAIASTVFRPDVREAMPNPGPLVIFTSGLYPGHSAQYNRVSSGLSKWTKIGETTGFGSFHIGVDTSRAIEDFNTSIDGYARITRRFGEGSGARFRSVGRALGRLGLPDLRKHETKRPLYALPLVRSPQHVLLGWDRAEHVERPSAQTLGEDWWQRWVEPRHTDLAGRSMAADDLLTMLEQIAKDLRDRSTT
ncbi:MAG: Druantia anti-phage system protein DruA [Solirubrobacteraceae bacterium]